MVGIFIGIHYVSLAMDDSREFITVGFVYAGDESTPYTANFIKAEKAVREKPQSAKYMEGFQHVKTIVVPKKIVNIVLKKA